MSVTSSSLDQDSSRTKVEASVPRWFSRIPLYQERDTCAPPGKAAEAFWDCFRKQPTITKREIQKGFPRNFLPAGAELETLVNQELVEVERTSGTSESPIPLLLPQGWWPVQERAALVLNHKVAEVLQSGARRVTIISPLCSSELSFKGIPTQLDRILGQSLFINLTRHPFLWTDADLERMTRETAEWEPVFLDVDPVYGALFALYCLSKGIQFPSLRFILSSYEFLSIHHRRIMERAFQVPVYNLYGSTETGHLLMENEQGKMVPSLSIAYLELIEVDEQGIGELVVTTLDNEYMPLVRYKIGDLARQEQSQGRIAYQLHGRSRDALRDVSGKRITTAQIDQCTELAKGMVHYQLRQIGRDQYAFYYFGAVEKSARIELDRVRDNLKELLHTSQEINFVPTDLLLPESSGKFRLTLPFLF